MAQRKKRDKYQEATDRMVALMEQGTVPWRRPWDENKAGIGLPMNGETKRCYRGVNLTHLMCNKGYLETGDPRFFTFNQIKNNGWSLDKGTKGTKVYFYKTIEIDTEEAAAEEDKKVIPFLKDFAVWHASQINGCPEYVPQKIEQPDWQASELVKKILEASGADIRIGGITAFYSPTFDYIQLPPEQAFVSEEGYASTALHELAHWTGHESRLNRPFGSQRTAKYAREELRAELASVFLCGELGINYELEQHASYLSSWVSNLKNDKCEIFRASSDAQRITDYIMDKISDVVVKNDAAKSANG